MEYMEFAGKTVDDAVIEACTHFGVARDKVTYEVIDEGSSGLLGIGAKPAQIKAALKEASLEETATAFLDELFKAMNLEVAVDTKLDEVDRILNIDLSGPEMGVLIGKRGQTLDSVQYLASLVVNKHAEEYVHVKVDTENYRERRKATLENLAKNISFKVKKTRRPVTLEPMNPYERRIIHSALQGDHYVTTHSEGEEPYRHVVVTLKR